MKENNMEHLFQPKTGDVKAIVHWLENNCSLCIHKNACVMQATYEYTSMVGKEMINKQIKSLMFDTPMCSKFRLNSESNFSEEQIRNIVKLQDEELIKQKKQIDLQQEPLN